MKQFKFLSVLLITLALTSCNEAEIQNALVVEQINVVEECTDCYQYRVKLKTTSGVAYYLTDYKHEVGDTLVSIFEFKDNREGSFKKTELVIDSLNLLNSQLQKKNDELTLYNQILMGIIQENTKKTSEN